MTGSDIKVIVIIISIIIFLFGFIGMNCWALDNRRNRLIRWSLWAELAFFLVWLTYGLLFHVDWSR